MSVSDGLKRTAAERSRLKCLRDNAAAYFTLFGRKPRAALTRPAALYLGAGTVGAIAMIVVTMMMVDARSIGVVQRLPEWLIASFDRITDFGRSVWFLVPIALVLAVMAALASPALPAMSRRVLAAVAVRLGFLFSAIALPGLVFTIVKRLIGRARPLVGGSADPFLYLPLGWKVEYASFPSGHATDAFAAATAIGVLWPQARPWMWTYAVIIAVSRVVLTAHFPSDVLAGAIVGVTGAVLVRAWFASRRLAFAPGADGRIRPMPGPSFVRVKRVARALIAP
jgi:membrane-associated phospholipid phosphatase